MSSDNGKWHGNRLLRHGNFLNWHLSSSYLSSFLFLPLSLFLSRFPFFLPFSPYYTSPSPLSSPVLRFRHYSSKSGTPHVPQPLGDLDDFGRLSDAVFFAILILKGNYKTSWTWAPLISVTARKRRVGSGRVLRCDLDYRGSYFLALSTAFFSLLKINGTLQLTWRCIFKLPLTRQSQFKTQFSELIVPY